MAGALAAMLVASAALVGCGKAPPPTDLTKAPWLDPHAQIENLKNQDSRIRGIAVQHLGNMGARAVEAIAALEKIAQHDLDAKVREYAKQAIEKIRSAAP